MEEKQEENLVFERKRRPRVRLSQAGTNGAKINMRMKMRISIRI